VKFSYAFGVLHYTAVVHRSCVSYFCAYNAIFPGQVRKPDGSLSECQHCFPVYGGGLEVKGVQGILQVRAVFERLF
jgi:hypothetical protein